MSVNGSVMMYKRMQNRKCNGHVVLQFSRSFHINKRMERNENEKSSLQTKTQIFLLQPLENRACMTTTAFQMHSAGDKRSVRVKRNSR